jgi:hypothetical protein
MSERNQPTHKTPSRLLEKTTDNQQMFFPSKEGQVFESEPFQLKFPSISLLMGSLEPYGALLASLWNKRCHRFERITENITNESNCVPFLTHDNSQFMRKQDLIPMVENKKRSKSAYQITSECLRLPIHINSFVCKI